VLCENNKVEYLCELPFEGYTEEVKKILEEKARYSDIHKQNYYNILYAFHISKSNYRQGKSYLIWK
jgi:nuclear pore complex protein Nup160